MDGSTGGRDKADSHDVEPPPGRDASSLDYTKALSAEFLSEVAQLIGTRLALTLARRLGGKRIYIPKVPGAAHKVARCIGLAAARRLGAALGGESFIVPRAASYLRWLDARALRILGLSHAEIAERIGINDRSVRRVLQGFRPEDYAIDETVREVARLYGIDLPGEAPTRSRPARDRRDRESRKSAP